MQFIKLAMLCFISVLVVSVSRAVDLPEDYYHRKVQPLFDNRCLACHSCFNAPCQLNLQSFEGFERGAHKLNVYQGTRVKSVAPTRMWIDGHSEKEWRKKGFFAVNTSKNSQDNLFLKFLNLRLVESQREVQKQVADSQVCASSLNEFERVAKGSPELGMPYGLPPLLPSEIETLKTWIEAGAPGPKSDKKKERVGFPLDLQLQLRDWELYFNGTSLEQKLVSRYVFEHLFLAHIYFPQQPGIYFRLVRSSSPCSEGIQEIATRRPNDDPGRPDFYYCLQRFPGTVVSKTHITFEFSPSKLRRFRDIFALSTWSAKSLPGYEPGVAENPFIAFRDIPARSRFEFLLDEAQYHVNTFIKGPVCNGSMAVNSIQEQFYVLFLSPQADNMVLSKEYDERTQQLLMMPGVWGSDVEVIDTPLFMKKLVDHREAYRKTRLEWKKKLRPEGYSLQDIWDGDKSNANALLTVFRHDDNAMVAKGAVGDLSKTVFILDYPLFERLVYNLVVNFDVFGNVGHQYLTRLYMDLIRMEAEELFLSFLPSEDRLSYRQKWYRGLITQAKLTYIFPTVGVAEPTAIRFREEKNTKKQMIEKVLFYLLAPEVRGPLDRINWKELQVPSSAGPKSKMTKNEQEFRRIASLKAVPKTPFARFFPELSLIKIRDSQGGLSVYSIIHHKEHENISWVLAESMRLAPKEDSLTIQEGYWGSYPNMFFDVTEKSLPDFISQVKSMKTSHDFSSLVAKYGVRRSQSTFWSHYDELTEHFRKNYPVQFGYLDLTRYELN